MRGSLLRAPQIGNVADAPFAIGEDSDGRLGGMGGRRDDDGATSASVAAVGHAPIIVQKQRVRAGAGITPRVAG